MSTVHPTAIIHPDTVLGEDVEIGPFAIVGPGCTIGSDCVIGPRAMLERNVRLGRAVRVGAGSIIGGDPQDLKFGGEETWVEIGDESVVREYATVNRGTRESLRTSIGSHCLVMSYVHLAHDCHVGNNVILANMVQLAGHVVVEDDAIISAMTGVHQFVRIGAHAFVGGFSKVAKDVPPYVKANGNPATLFGLNSVGLERKGISSETRAELKRAYRLFFASGLNVTQARERAESELRQLPEVQTFLRFLSESQRGVLV